MLGQIDGNHTSSQFALSHGGRETKGWRAGGSVCRGGGGGGGVLGGVCSAPLGTEKSLDSCLEK